MKWNIRKQTIIHATPIPRRARSDKTSGTSVGDGEIGSEAFDTSSSSLSSIFRFLIPLKKEENESLASHGLKLAIISDAINLPRETKFGEIYHSF